MQGNGIFAMGRWRCLCFLVILASFVVVVLTPYTNLTFNGQEFRNATSVALGNVYTYLTESLKYSREDAAGVGEYWAGSVWPEMLSTRAWQEKASSTSTSANRTIKIFYWTGQYKARDWSMGAGHAPFLKNNCTIHQCEFSSDPNAFNSSDFLLIHQAGLNKGLPNVKLPGQRWIFRMAESPVYSSHFKWTNLNGNFEIIIDDTLFADVTYLGSYFRRNPTTVRDKMVDYAAGKNRGRDSLVAWFVSHCGTQSVREKYVRELQKHIHVDVYGGCGPKKCRRTPYTRALNKDPCMNYLQKQYKFYLSFENSLCEDYITEKIWSLFEEGINIVPVVLGAANYTKFFPPHSYIDVLDFDSPQHLAQYLYKLNENDTLYNEYFVWRDRYSVEPHRAMTCGLCSYLHTNVNIPQEVHRDLDQMKSVKKHCVTPKEYYGSKLKI